MRRGCIRLREVATGKRISGDDAPETPTVFGVFMPRRPRNDLLLTRKVACGFGKDAKTVQRRRLFDEDYGTSPVSPSRPTGRHLPLPFSGETWGVDIWDVATGEKIRRLVEQKEPVFLRAFSPDGKCVLTTTDDDDGIETTDIRVWSIKTASPSIHIDPCTGNYRDVRKFLP